MKLKKQGNWKIQILGNKAFTNFWKNPLSEKLDGMLPNSWTTEWNVKTFKLRKKSQSKLEKCYEMNENKHLRYQNLCGETKLIQKGKFIAQ